MKKVFALYLLTTLCFTVYVKAFDIQYNILEVEKNNILETKDPIDKHNKTSPNNKAEEQKEEKNLVIQDQFILNKCSLQLFPQLEILNNFGIIGNQLFEFHFVKNINLISTENITSTFFRYLNSHIVPKAP